MTSQSVHASSEARKSDGGPDIQDSGVTCGNEVTSMHVYRNGMSVGWGEAWMLQCKMVHFFGCATGKPENFQHKANHDNFKGAHIDHYICTFCLHVGIRSVCMQLLETEHAVHPVALGPAPLLHMSIGGRTKWVLLGW